MRELTDGSTAIVRGALDAGCDFFAGYPITPASPILMSLMRELPRRGGVAIQGEDEIASIGMCIGATLGGARALTATSGPGISLYSESIGLAVMGEVPLVIVDVQQRWRRWGWVRSRLPAPHRSSGCSSRMGIRPHGQTIDKLPINFSSAPASLISRSRKGADRMLVTAFVSRALCTAPPLALLGTA